MKTSPTMDLWRISNYRTLDGEGGRRYAARWHSAGSPIVYLASSPAGALLEHLVHLELSLSVMPSYSLLQVSVPTSLRIPTLKASAYEAWKTDISLTQSLGYKWLKARRSALARVPSVILPHTFNYLFNPLHLDAAYIKIASVTSTPYDTRLIR